MKGATDVGGKAAKEAEYLQEEDSDYLIQALSAIPHTLTATVDVIKETDD